MKNSDNVLKNKEAFLFDFDGLLIDSEPVWGLAHGEFFDKYNLKDDPSHAGKFHGAGLVDNIKFFQNELGLKGALNELLIDYRKILYKIADSRGGFGYLPGAIELIEFLYKNNYTLAVATGGHTGDGVREVLSKKDLDKYFTVLVSSDEVEKGKPDPDVYLLTAKKLKVDPSGCVVLEDSINGILSGVSADMTTIGVIDSEDYQVKMDQAGADIIVDSLDQIILLLK